MNMNKLVDAVQVIIKNSKYKDMYKAIKEVKDINFTEAIDLHDVMKFINDRKIRPFESFYIYGYLSSTACLEIPETYFNETREYVKVEKEYYKGRLYNQAIMSVEENSLPQCHPNYGKDLCIAFLYKDKGKRFKATKNKEGKEVLNKYQQFIPIILDEKDYYKYVDTYVRLKSCVVPLEKLFLGEDLKIEEDKYSYLNECFYDIYQPQVTSFFLKCLSISSDITLNYDNDEIIQFIVEYEIISNESSRGLFKKVVEFLSKRETSGLPNNFTFDTGHILFPSENNISICIKNKKIGFYKKINIKDSEEYKKELKELENYIKCFFRKYRFVKEMSFVSDYRRKDIFDI